MPEAPNEVLAIDEAKAPAPAVCSVRAAWCLRAAWGARFLLTRLLRAIRGVQHMEAAVARADAEDDGSLFNGHDFAGTALVVGRGRYAASYVMLGASMQHYRAVLLGEGCVRPPLAVVRLRVADDGEDEERDVGGGGGGGGGAAAASAAPRALLDSVTSHGALPVCTECKGGALIFRFDFPGHIGSVVVEWWARLQRVATPTEAAVFRHFVLPLCGATDELSIWGASVVRAAAPHGPGTSQVDRTAADTALVAEALRLWKEHCRRSPYDYHVETETAAVHVRRFSSTVSDVLATQRTALSLQRQSVAATGVALRAHMDERAPLLAQRAGWE